MNTPQPHNRIRVWDAPIRVFHWVLVAAFTVAWLTYDDNRYLHIHVISGYLITGLLVFRIVWGVGGTRYARFGEFVRGWPAVRDYLKGLAARDPEATIGHNPVAAWAILYLIGMSLMVAVSGIFVLGIEEGHGPLGAWMAPYQAEMFRELHEIAAWAVLLFVPIHIIGVIVEGKILGESLIGAMFHGHKWAEPGTPEVPARRRLAALIAGLCAIATAVYLSGMWLDDEYRPYQGRQLMQNDLYIEECGACHLAYHPTLLPARSWQRTMDEQADHFGEDLMFEPETVDELLAYMLAHSAETEVSEPAYKINLSLEKAQQQSGKILRPLRITDTPYYQHKHDAVPQSAWDNPKVFGKADCAACHLDAEQGTFEDGAMRLPSPNDGATP